MFRVLHKEDLTATVHLIEIEAPGVARKVQPGQFAVLMVDEAGERIPFTIADWDPARGSVSIVVSAVGTSTSKLGRLKEGDSVAHFAGPLGKPAGIDRFGEVACVAIGYGIAAVTPIAQALRGAQNRVHSVVSAPTKQELFGIDRLRAASDELIVATADGSYGEQGWVLDPLRRLLAGSPPLNRVFAMGPVCMMKMVASAAKKAGVTSIVSLNPIMVDGTGMCGACRVSVGGGTKFACVDGPLFEGRDVDWDLLMARRCTYPAGMLGEEMVYRCRHCGQW